MFKKLTLADKNNFDVFFQKIQPEISDLTFTNLLMWQDTYGLRVECLAELDFWILWATPEKWSSFFLPMIGDWSDLTKLRQILAYLDRIAEKEGFSLTLRRLPQQLAENLVRLDSSLQLEEERSTFDYLYNSAELINLAGRKYHSKRNHFNQFQRKYSWEYQSMTPSLAEACLRLETSWLNLNPTQNEPLSDEALAMRIVLENFEVLGVCGGVLLIEGEIQALAVGETLNKNTAVIHIEKANTAYEGTYAAINQQFATHELAKFELINREEDMGLEGLRQAKLSYQPSKLVQKFVVKRR